MSAKNILVPVEPAIDPALDFGYGSTDVIAVFQCATGKIHFIWHAGNPTGVAAFLNNTPNGSIIFDTTNKVTYHKSGLPGSGTDGTIA